MQWLDIDLAQKLFAHGNVQFPHMMKEVQLLIVTLTVVMCFHVGYSVSSRCKFFPFHPDCRGHLSKRSFQTAVEQLAKRHQHTRTVLKFDNDPNLQVAMKTLDQGYIGPTDMEQCIGLLESMPLLDVYLHQDKDTVEQT